MHQGQGPARQRTLSLEPHLRARSASGANPPNCIELHKTRRVREARHHQLPPDGGSNSRARAQTTVFHRREKQCLAKNRRLKAEFILFDVHYEDGTRTSNRKVPGSVLGGIEGDAPAQAIIESQDQEIAERSGRARPAIKFIIRTSAAAKAAAKASAK